MLVHFGIQNNVLEHWSFALSVLKSPVKYHTFSGLPKNNFQFVKLQAQIIADNQKHNLKKKILKSFIFVVLNKTNYVTHECVILLCVILLIYEFTIKHLAVTGKMKNIGITLEVCLLVCLKCEWNILLLFFFLAALIGNSVLSFTVSFINIHTHTCACALTHTHTHGLW